MTRTELLAVAKPILFNTEMVQAILEGRKTVTRRVIKPQPQQKNQFFRGFCTSSTDKKNIGCASFSECDLDGYNVDHIKPPFRHGNILYVRETWTRLDCCCCDGDMDGMCFNEPDEKDGCFLYRATHTINGDTRWRPSIHMPKEAARLFLRVKDVRPERLQDITSEQCIVEGVEHEAQEVGSEFVRGMFSDIWDSTIKPANRDKYGWNANPWVWVIKFELIEAEV